MNLKRICQIIFSIVVFTTFIISAQENNLPRSTPESEGISSKAIIQFLDAAEKSNAEFHSFMLLRHGKVVAEGWWNPYRRDLVHTLYSCSKSFTSTGIGFAVTEGLLSVDDKVTSFFPNELPKAISPFLEELKVSDLLSMTAGHDPDPTGVVTQSDNWIKTFLEQPIKNEPGTKFLYNTAATYALSAILQKVTGQKLLDYLTPRFFEPLGIEGIDWEENLQGENTGGWGLRLKTEDMAKAGQFFLQKGKWNGKQILPAEWIEEATSIKTDQGPEWAQSTPKDSSDWLQGYCYQFWRCRHNAFRADGAYGQFIVVMPDQEAVFIMTGEAADLQEELNLVWQYLLPEMKLNRLPDDESSLKALNEKLASLSLSKPFNQNNSSLFNAINNKEYTLNNNELGYKSVKFNFKGNNCKAIFNIDGDDFEISFGKDKWIIGETEKAGPSLTSIRKVKGNFIPKVAGAYSWKDNKTIELTLRYIESPHSEFYTFTFNGNEVKGEFRNSLPYTRNIVALNGIITK